MVNCIFGEHSPHWRMSFIRVYERANDNDSVALKWTTTKNSVEHKKSKSHWRKFGEEKKMWSDAQSLACGFVDVRRHHNTIQVKTPAHLEYSFLFNHSRAHPQSRQLFFMETFLDFIIIFTNSNASSSNKLDLLRTEPFMFNASAHKSFWPLFGIPREIYLTHSNQFVWILKGILSHIPYSLADLFMPHRTMGWIRHFNFHLITFVRFNYSNVRPQ